MNNNTEFKNEFKILGVDIAKLPDQSVELFVGAEPKIKCKNKFLQKILVKMFGYMRTLSKNAFHKWFKENG